VQITLIALILIAFLGGILSKCNTAHVNQGGAFFNVLGFKSKEQIQQEQLNQLMGKYLKDKNELLGGVQSEMGPLSQAVKDASDKDQNVDLLRLKGLMSRFEDQNVLMIEDGKELLNYNEQQKKRNKKMAQDADRAAFLSKSAQQELLARQKDTLEKQRDLIDQLQQLQQSDAIRNNAQLSSQLSNLSAKSSAALENLKQEQDHIDQLRQNSLRSPDELKQKIEDLKNRNEDQLRQNNDRMRDQMERLRDKSRK